MRKKLITYFLLLVMSIQILPVQQLGRMLFCNQFTEELSHQGLDTDKDGFQKGFDKGVCLYTSGFFFDINSSTISSQYLHFADAIPLSHEVDIHVPPPNC
ncbi:MAG: hypothetical protein I8H66_04895 [Sphingobacteriia bacterium]|nr:hypothetical protein [Sphingobacteriia bacterium]